MVSPMEKIYNLENIEKEIAEVLQCAAQALQELSKDKPANKQVESHVEKFLKTLTHVEAELSKQINYLTQVSTGQAHEGSSYVALKMYQMSCHRVDLIKQEVIELEKIRNQMMRPPPQLISQQPVYTNQTVQQHHQAPS